MGLPDSKNTHWEKKATLKTSTLKTSTLLLFSEGLTLTSCGKTTRGAGLLWQRTEGKAGPEQFCSQKGTRGALGALCWLPQACQSQCSLSEGQPRSALSLLQPWKLRAARGFSSAPQAARTAALVGSCCSQSPPAPRALLLCRG